MKEKVNSILGKSEELRVQHSLRLLKILDDRMMDSSMIHQDLLNFQNQAMAAISSLTNILPTDIQEKLEIDAIFTRRQLEEFANGSIAKCFGPQYEVLDQRKTPRIPNGRLLLMDWVKDISGQRMNINPPATIVTEFDIQPDSWFIRSNKYQGIPLAVLMEIALQPCGILSAHLGTSLVIPAENNLFRNLDGWMQISRGTDLVGATITNRVELTNTIAGAGLYIQTFKFELSSDNQPFLSGESSFGYFTQPVMDNQKGLDLGEKRVKMIDDSGFANDFQVLDTDTICNENTLDSDSLLNLSDTVWFNPTGGRTGKGAVIGQKKIHGDEWFFENHFYQDPVMPGSLGVEAITRGLYAFLKMENPDPKKITATIEFPDNKPLRWKYRGQVLPSNRETYFELHIKETNQFKDQPQVIADADFWVDDLWIYTIENLSMTLGESSKK